MKIFLDTNILVRDFGLKSREFEMLFDYLSRSDASVVFPAVVIEELEAKYSEKLIELTDGIRRLHSVLHEPDSELEKMLVALDFSSATAKYRGYLLKRFGMKDTDILPYDGQHLQEVSRRAIRRIPPITKRGEEFRDAILWLSLVDATVDSDSKTAILISNDGDFTSDSGSLNKTLAEEAESRSIRVVLYKSIGEFIRARADEVAYISLEWLEQHVENEIVEDQLRASIDGFSGSHALLRWFRENKPNAWISSSSVQFEGLSGVELVEFYVYEMADGSHRVNATYRCSLEVTYVDAEATQRNWESELETSFPIDQLDAWDYPRIQGQASPVLRSANPFVTASVYIVLRGRLVESVELEEWSLE